LDDLMILITPEDGPDGLSDSIAAVQRQLSDMRDELDRVYERIKSGDLDELKNAGKTLSELRGWLRLALEAEVYLEKRRKEKQGIVHDFAVNLDEARSAIGSRLDNLRRDRQD
jgi:hypothetical protein